MRDTNKPQPYKNKRDFQCTSEPSGGHSRAQPVFVIQKHDASNLHYDFRVEMDGVLKSWAIPKGPSTDPREKRLAIQTEDHPLDYASFEGVIPEDEYGGGTVLMWDSGPYTNMRKSKDEETISMQEAYEDGLLEMRLEGKKLRGGFALKRTSGNGQQSKWLLIKMKDDGADARRNPVSTEPDSVVSGKSITEIEHEH